MRLRATTWLVALVLALAACATTVGGLRADAQAAAVTASTYADQTARLLQADLITVADAQKRLDVIRQVRTSLREVEKQINACEAAKQTTCDPARVALSSSRAALAQVEVWLIEQEKRRKP